MRTTITIDDDVASRLGPLIDKRGGKTKAVINDLLRKALGISQPREIDIPSYALGFLPGIDPASLNKLAEDQLRADAEGKLRS